MDSITALGTTPSKPIKLSDFVKFARLVARKFLLHAILFAVLAIYFTANEMFINSIPGIHGNKLESAAGTFIFSMIPIILIAIITLRFLRLIVVVRPDRPLFALYHDVKNFLFHPERLANAIPVLTATYLLTKVFAHIKSNIPVINPYSWDPYFAELDQWLHFGVHPWQWLQPILGYPLVTFTINILYNMWFIVMWMVWAWFAFSKQNSSVRLRYFLTFILTWTIGGSLMAIMYASGGPAYFGLLGYSPDPYIPLMTYLHDVNEIYPIWALDVQKTLWASYQGVGGAFDGISAMPSLHNASAALMALAAWKMNRTAGILLTLFAVIILIGSVHLGWHYAIDGYAGIALAVSLWWVSGPIIAGCELLFRTDLQPEESVIVQTRQRRFMNLD